MSSDPLREMRLGDLLTLLAVLRSDSISAAARELGVTASQVSKAVARLESAWGIRLLARSSRGTRLSDAGRATIGHVEDAVALLRRVGEATRTPHVTVAGPSSLLEALLPAIATSTPDLRVRGLVLPHQLVRADASDNVFDAALLIADVERLPPSWVSTPIGELRQALFASPTVAARLGVGPVHRDRLLGVPFVVPVYRADGRYVAVEDDCPLPFRDRVVGHEAQTIGLALTLAACTDQLVFGPAIAAHEHLQAGRLVEIRVHGWRTRDRLYLACNGDRVLSRVQHAMVKALRAALHALDPNALEDSAPAPSSRRGRAQPD